MPTTENNSGGVIPGQGIGVTLESEIGVTFPDDVDVEGRAGRGQQERKGGTKLHEGIRLWYTGKKRVIFGDRRRPLAAQTVTSTCKTYDRSRSQKGNVSLKKTYKRTGCEQKESRPHDQGRIGEQ